MRYCLSYPLEVGPTVVPGISSWYLFIIPTYRAKTKGVLNKG